MAEAEEKWAKDRLSTFYRKQSQGRMLKRLLSETKECQQSSLEVSTEEWVSRNVLRFQFPSFFRFRWSIIMNIVIKKSLSFWIILVKWSCSVVSNSVTPWTVPYHSPPSMGFSRQEYWSTLGTQGSNPALLHCRQMLYCLSYQFQDDFITYRKAFLLRKMKVNGKIFG